jgi:hypothetical protein
VQPVYNEYERVLGCGGLDTTGSKNVTKFNLPLVLVVQINFQSCFAEITGNEPLLKW